MKRKLIEQGGGTLMVSLPSRWAKDFELEKGDEVEIEELGKQIVISNSKEIRFDSIQVDISGLDERVIRWVIAALHKAGYDEISIVYDNPKVIKVVQELIRDLLVGFAIVGQTSNRCIIKCISKSLESEFDITLKRAFFVTINMGESLYEMLKSGSIESVPDLLALEHTNNQLTNFCHRILNKKGYREYKKTNFIYTIIWNLEKIADDYKLICEYLPQSGKKTVSTSILSALKKTNDYFKVYFDLLYKFDLKALDEANKMRKSILKEISDIEPSKQEFPIIHYINSIVDKVTDFSGSIIGMHQETLKS